MLVEAAGNATQLGQFALAIPHLVDRVARTAVGSYHFTAANGDTLSADFTGQSMPTATLGVLSIVETATITGGTGRFAGATGSFTCERLYDTITGTTIGSFEGTISSLRCTATSETKRPVSGRRLPGSSRRLVAATRAVAFARSDQ